MVYMTILKFLPTVEKVCNPLFCFLDLFVLDIGLIEEARKKGRNEMDLILSIDLSVRLVDYSEITTFFIIWGEEQ